MSAITSIFIVNHTTSSDPRPHILYAINVHRDDGSRYEVLRRYSEFITLREKLSAPFSLPPKRNIVSSLFPYKWMDDGLIDERKRALQLFLTLLIHDMRLRLHSDLLFFLGANDLSAQDSMIWPPLNEMASKESLIPTKASAKAPDGTLKPVAASYYPSWASDIIPVSKINFSKFDILFFAFVTPNGVAGINWDGGSQETLKELVSYARKSGKGTKIVLSVGGWGGSHWYSQAMSTESNRSKLVKTLAETVELYGLDGIDIDWEYPNAPGAGNPHSSADAGNLLSFFKLLRSTLGSSSKVISAAVTHLPWLGENGQPLNNVAEYAKYITYVNIMNYDIFGASAHPGPNAPLGNLCGSSSQPQSTAQAALTQWKSAGMPASKILLGLPLYGYVSKSSDSKLSGSSIPSSIFQHGAHPKFANKLPHTSIPLGDLSALWGQQISFSQLVRSGALVKKSDGTYTSANGYTMGWDNCSDTPYLFNTTRTTVVTYDDTYSIASKTAFAKESGMGGCFTWSLDQDDDLVLHNVILENLGR